jgi:hypothetical protein
LTPQLPPSFISDVPPIKKLYLERIHPIEEEIKEE